MTILDNLLQSDICSWEDCGNESFRNCVAGCGWRCSEHPCPHMDSDSIGSWLSVEAVAGRMSDEELASAKVRLALQLQTIHNEIERRQRGNELDVLFHTSFTRRTTRRQRQKPKKDIFTAKSLLANFLDSLSPQQVVKLEQKLRKEKEGNK